MMMNGKVCLFLHENCFLSIYKKCTVKLFRRICETILQLSPISLLLLSTVVDNASVLCVLYATAQYVEESDHECIL